MTGYQIRQAQQEDLPKLLAFEQGIIAVERPWDETLKPDPISYYDLESKLYSNINEVVVAVLDGQVVASAYAEIRPAKPYLKHKKYAHLGFMFVEADHRGKGINGAIIDYLKKWCSDQGVTELRLEVYDENASAVRAYEKVGFTKHMITMRIDTRKDN